MLERIRRQYAQLSMAERKVADIVLRRPNECVHAAVADIARNAQVSQPTVIRFARSLGCNGLQEFKLKLAASLVGGVPFVHASVSQQDSVPELSAKVFDNVISALIKCRNDVSPQALEDAIGLIANARRLEFYGLGNSGIIAADAQHKFFRYDIPAVAYSDAHVQSMAATLLGPADVLVAISNSGRSNELLDAVGIALDGGCKVIAITAPASPLSKLATIAIDANAREDSEVYSPMISRILALTIIDILAVGVAIKRGPQLIQTLERTKHSLRQRKRRLDE